MSPAKHGIDKIEYYLNGRLQYTAKDAPYDGSVRIARNSKPSAAVNITVTVYDTLSYRSSTQITVYVADNNDLLNPNDIINDENSNETDTAAPLLENEIILPD